jgi:pimeloyl-ACP methyl ester carboxylesterase
MPGFGRSERLAGAPSLDEWARGVLAWCKAHDVEQALIAGCSMGGYLSFAIARQAPRFATAFAFIDTRAAADSQEAKRGRYEIVERARHEGTAFLTAAKPHVSAYTLEHRPDVVAEVLALTADATPVGVMAAQRAMASRKDARSLLPAIDVPVTVIRGEDDSLIPQAEAEAMAAAIAGARFVSIPRAGHLSPLEDPQAITQELRLLLERSQSR